MHGRVIKSHIPTLNFSEQHDARLPTDLKLTKNRSGRNVENNKLKNAINLYEEKQNWLPNLSHRAVESLGEPSLTKDCLSLLKLSRPILVQFKVLKILSQNLCSSTDVILCL